MFQLTVLFNLNHLPIKNILTATLQTEILSLLSNKSDSPCTKVGLATFNHAKCQNSSRFSIQPYLYLKTLLEVSVCLKINSAFPREKRLLSISSGNTVVSELTR